MSEHDVIARPVKRLVDGPERVVLIAYSDDPRPGATVLHPGQIPHAVRLALFGGTDLSEEDERQVAVVVQELVGTGSVDLEDGSLVLARLELLG